MEYVKVPAHHLHCAPERVFQRFPMLTRTTILGVEEEDLPLLARPAVCDTVIDLEMCLQPVEPWCPASSLTLPALPNLRALTVRGFSFDTVLPFPHTLQAVDLADPVASDHVDALTRLPDLTHLSFGSSCSDWSVAEPMEALPALTNLQSLEITCTSYHIPSLGTLTRLTFLSWRSHSQYDDSADLAPLTHLQSLLHLGIGPMNLKLWRAHFVAIGTLTTLQSLQLLVHGPTLTASDAAPLTHLTELTRLGLFSDGHLSFLGRMHVQGLQDLALQNVYKLGRSGVSLLQQATGMTRLQFGYTYSQGMVPAEEFCQVMSAMSRLQSLSLNASLVLSGSWFDSIAALTGLTELEWRGDHLTSPDMDACARIRSLRTLQLLPDRIALSGHVDIDAFLLAFLALAKLPELSNLLLGEAMGIQNIYKEMATLVDAERHARGWPGLDINFEESYCAGHIVRRHPGYD
jgi:hypothetical protein